MDSLKMMAFGKQVNLVPETLGVHIEETEDKLLDIPLVADKVGSLSESDISQHLVRKISKTSQVQSSYPNFPLYVDSALDVVSVTSPDAGLACIVPFRGNGGSWYGHIIAADGSTTFYDQTINIDVYYIEA